MSTAGEAAPTETPKAAELAARAAYIKAGNACTASGSTTMLAERALENARMAEKQALVTFRKTKAAWDQATETLNAVEAEIAAELLTARANKFRAVVDASGLTTRAPSAGLSYKSGNATEDESDHDASDNESCKSAEYNPTSPDHTPGSSPRALSPLVSSSVIDSWE